MRKIEIPADWLVASLLKMAGTRNVAILDSCGVGSVEANLLIAGIDPVEVFEMSNLDPTETLRIFDEKLAAKDLAAIFTISYDFGLKLQHIERQQDRIDSPPEPDIFIALFDHLVIHNYADGQTFLSGNSAKFDKIQKNLLNFESRDEQPSESRPSKPVASCSNFTKPEYLDAINKIKELIRSGDTYQTNLTQQLSVELSNLLTAAHIFERLRRDHPAPFAAYIDRGTSKVVSASPIKGTRRRGSTAEEDQFLCADLLTSEKDRAENTMIVDLVRNDFGRICDYGSVSVESLGVLEEHPTLFHLASTVNGILREGTTYSDILKAVFPCGSITGAPKVRTMHIIDEIEDTCRGLSMGAIGCSIPEGSFGLPAAFEMSVAIRTMIIRDGKAVLNVGGGIVIDSDPESEYAESLLKAKALLRALNPGKTE